MNSQLCEIYTNEIIDRIHVIAAVGFFSSAVSICGTVSVIGFILWKRLYFRQEMRPLLHLSIADCLLALLWISSSISYFSTESRTDFKSVVAKTCFVWQLMTELVHLVTFFLTINYSVNVYLQMKKRTERVHLIPDPAAQSMKSSSPDNVKNVLYAISWLLPWILLIPLFVNIKMKNISLCQKCVILIDVPRLVGTSSEIIQQYGYIVLATTLAFSMISISVLYGMTLRLYWKAVPGFHTDRQRIQLSNMQTRITLYMLAFLICWGPALLISCYKWNELQTWKKDLSSYDLQHYYVLYLLQAILAPLQGFLNSLVYGWTRKSFRQAAGPSDNHRSSAFVTPYYEQLPSVTTYEDSVEVDQSRDDTPLPF